MKKQPEQKPVEKPVEKKEPKLEIKVAYEPMTVGLIHLSIENWRMITVALSAATEHLKQVPLASHLDRAMDYAQLTIKTDKLYEILKKQQDEIGGAPLSVKVYSYKWRPTGTDEAGSAAKAEAMNAKKEARESGLSLAI